MLKHKIDLIAMSTVVKILLGGWGDNIDINPILMYAVSYTNTIKTIHE